MYVMPYGFIDYRGHRWVDTDVDLYNRLNKQVEELEDRGQYPIGSSAYAKLEARKDARHKMFVQIVASYEERG